MWKTAKEILHPAKADTALPYLVYTGIQKLVVGFLTIQPGYGAIPSIPCLRQPWLSTKKTAFPLVKNWDVLMAGLNYPDIPNEKVSNQNERHVGLHRNVHLPAPDHRRPGSGGRASHIRGGPYGFMQPVAANSFFAPFRASCLPENCRGVRILSV
jgi:hypothetical protein